MLLTSKKPQPPKTTPKGDTKESTPQKAFPIDDPLEGVFEPPPAFVVEWWPIEKVKRYGNNPRKNAHTVSQVRTSIEEFEWQQPIVVDEEGVIIVGDTRYCAALDMGVAHVPIKVAVGLSPAKVKAYRLVDNKVGESSQWDEARLIQEMLELMDSGETFDLTAMGFSADDIAMVEPKALPKIEEKYLQDFDVMPAPKPRWVLISAPEAAVAHIIKTVEDLGYEHVKIESSAYASTKKQGKLS